MAVKKLSGVAVPSCSWGSSQRDARPACQARTSFPLAAAPAGDESAAAVDASTISIRAAATHRERLMSGPPLGGSVAPLTREPSALLCRQRGQIIAQVREGAAAAVAFAPPRQRQTSRSPRRLLASRLSSHF